jgi:hypothetical protein
LRIYSIHQLSLWTELNAAIAIVAYCAYLALVVALPCPGHLLFLGAIGVQTTADPEALALIGYRVLFGDLSRVQVVILICFKLIDQFIYLLYVDLSSVVLVKHLENLLVLLTVEVKFILLGATNIQDLGRCILLRLNLLLVHF